MTYSGAPSSIELLEERLQDFRAHAVAKDEQYGTLSIDLSCLFRRLQGRTNLLLMTYRFAEDILTHNPQWIVDQFLNLADVVGVVPIFLLGRPATKQSANFVHSKLKSLDFLEGQPIIIAETILESHKGFDLHKILLNSTDYRLLSPYKIDEYAGSRMFFGRKQDLTELKSGRSNLILVGARRIGKSSLAMQLKETMGSIHLPAVGLKHSAREIPRCVYIDVSAIAAPVSKFIWDAILRRFTLDRRDLMSGGWRSDLLGKRPKGGAATFDAAMAVQSLINRFEGKLTIILDEVDSWIYEESNQLWPSLDKLRSFTDNGRARVILIGYESLAIAARYHKFPLAARGHYRLLGSIDFEAVKRLILEPLEELDIEIEPRSKEPILNRIWKTTSGFPHLVQDICGNIVKLIIADRSRSGRKNKQASPVVTVALVESAISQSNALKAFIDRIVDKDFPLARAIAAVCADSSLATGKDVSGSRPLTISEISGILEAAESGFTYSDSDFDLALTALELRSVLQPANPERTRWMWVNELARQSMEISIKDIGRKRFIDDLIQEHQEGKWREPFKKLHWSGHSMHSNKGATR